MSTELHNGSASTAPALGQPPEREVSVVGIANTLLRNRDRILRTALLLAVLMGGAAFLGARTYTSHASFVPQSRRTPSNIAGLAAQFGIAVPTGEAAQSPTFYAELMKSRAILGPLVDSTFRLQTGDGVVAGPLPRVLRIPEAAPEPERRDLALRRLSQSVVSVADQKTGVVRVSVTAASPTLARDLLVRVMGELNRFNAQTRQSQANAERRFTEQRMLEARTDLRLAEDRLQRWLEANRSYQGSPALVFEHDRLDREVALRNQLYTTVATAFEQAKIDEVRDTPAITMVETPEVPVRGNPRGTVKRAILGFGLGLALGVVLAFVRDVFGRGAASGGTERDAERAEFDALRRELAADVRRPWRPVGRLLGRRSRHAVPTG